MRRQLEADIRVAAAGLDSSHDRPGHATVTVTQGPGDSDSVAIAGRGQASDSTLTT